MRADVRLRLSDGTPYAETGILRFADVGVDEGTGTVTLRAEFPNADHELLPGMFVRAVVNMGVRHDALLLPQAAVLRDNRGIPFVFVAVAGEDGGMKAERRGVTLGAAYGDALIAALSAGHYRDSKELTAQLHISRQIDPDEAAHAAYAPLRRRYAALYERTREIMHEF